MKRTLSAHYYSGLRDSSLPLRLTRRELIAAAVPVPPRRPNLLILLAGRWRAQTLPSDGGDLLAPGLDRFTKAALRFTRSYASCPDRALSRASLLSGRFPHALRPPGGPPSEPALASELKRVGYAVSCTGDWGYPSVPTAQSASGFIRANIPNDFCLLVALERINPVPELYTRIYAGRRFSWRENLPKEAESAANEAYARYYAQCSALDSEIGRLLDVLEETGLAQDSIVVFTSDCGEMLGSHGLDGAGDPREESACVPLLVRYPRRLPGGAERDFPVSGVDLCPTLLRMCGAAIPSSVQGRDLSELILTGRGDPPESIYAEGALGTRDEWRMLVRGLDKLVVDMHWNATHLYNLGQDPYEMTNLAAARTEQRKRDELTALLRRWVLRTGDRLNRR